MPFKPCLLVWNGGPVLVGPVIYDGLQSFKLDPDPDRAYRRRPWGIPPNDLAFSCSKPVQYGQMMVADLRFDRNLVQDPDHWHTHWFHPGKPVTLRMSVDMGGTFIDEDLDVFLLCSLEDAVPRSYYEIYAALFGAAAGALVAAVLTYLAMS